jgi:hypothetical protein
VSERIEKLKHAVEKACRCKAIHARSSTVIEGIEGEHVWDGLVEVFDLEGHFRAKQCYAFLFAEDGHSVIKTVLGVQSIKSELDAVRMAIASKAREK